MLPRNTVCASLVTLLLAGSFSDGFAAWPHDPANGSLPICLTPTQQYSPIALADGTGGAFIVWYGTNSNDIFMQRVSAAGAPLWTTDGVIVCNFPAGQVNPVIALDGAGGVLVAWIDARNAGQNDVYAQRVNGSGALQWATDGVPICTASGDQGGLLIVSDGAGGAIMSWQDARGGAATDIYAQRVNGSGVAQWTGNGVALSASANTQDNPVIASDGSGGAIVCWQDQRAAVGAYDIYGQRVNAAGVPQWAANGIAFCPATGNQLAPRIVSDGAGGAIATWYDLRSGSEDIYAQHVTFGGTMLWNGNGTALCTATNVQNSPVLTTDGSGGAVIAWSDYRNGGVQDVYAQRINGSGTTLWTANGVALCTFTNTQAALTVTSDGAQGAIVAWQDYRGFSVDLYAQRVSASGAPLWATDGVAICTAIGSQSSQSIVPDGAGGAILAWADSRVGPSETDIYAQRIERFGQLGSPEPTIVSVRDVPGDQGGEVNLRFNASYLDADPWNLVTSYWVWRQAPSSVAITALARGARLEGQVDPAGAVPHDLWKITHDAAQAYYWEYVTSLPAQGFPGYSYVAATTSDSLGTGNPPTAFLVEAKSSGTAYWSSAPDSGYSVDNIAPATPAPFTGQYSSGTTMLHWGANGEADFLEYRLYRGSTPGFAPGAGNLVTAQSDTGYSDPAGALFYYKLAALDIHGNPGGYALLLPQSTVGVGEEGLATALDLVTLGSNPMRQLSTFGYALPATGRVRLSLFDQQGRTVRVLANGMSTAGVHRVTWDGGDDSGHRVPSGIYFCRLEVGGESKSVKIAVVR
jgi:FlgD Ig-like domain